MDEVAIIGRGNVGRALGSRLVEVGVSVRFGVRDPTALSPEDDRARTLSTKEAVAESAIILLAVPADAGPGCTSVSRTSRESHRCRLYEPGWLARWTDLVTS